MARDKSKGGFPAYEHKFFISLCGKLTHSEQDKKDRRKRQWAESKKREIATHVRREEEEKRFMESRIQGIQERNAETIDKAEKKTPRDKKGSAREKRPPSAKGKKRLKDSSTMEDIIEQKVAETVGLVPREKIYVFTMEFGGGERKTSSPVAIGDFSFSFEQSLKISEIATLSSIADGQGVEVSLYRMDKPKETEGEQPPGKQRPTSGLRNKNMSSMQDGQFISKFIVPLCELLVGDLSTKKEWNNICNVDTLSVTVSTDEPLLSKELDEKLRPLMISLSTLYDLPSQYPVRDKVKDLFLSFRFANRNFVSQSIPDPDVSRPIHIDFQRIIFLNHEENDNEELRDHLVNEPFIVEVHDRDPMDGTIQIVRMGKATFRLGELVNTSTRLQLKLRSIVTGCQAVRNGRIEYDENEADEGDQTQTKSRPGSSNAIRKSYMHDVEEKGKEETEKDRVEEAQKSISKPLPPADYMGCQTELKCKFRLSLPFTKLNSKSERLLVVIICPYGMIHVLDRIQEFVDKFNRDSNNSTASPSGSRPQSQNYNKRPSSRSSQRSRGQEQENDLKTDDILIGFEVCDGEKRIIIVEGLAESGIRSFMKHLSGESLNSDKSEVLILFNQNATFSISMYKSLLDITLENSQIGDDGNGDVSSKQFRRIRIKESLDSIMHHHHHQRRNLSVEMQMEKAKRSLISRFMEKIWQVRQNDTDVRGVKICVREAVKLAEYGQSLVLRSNPENEHSRPSPANLRSQEKSLNNLVNVATQLRQSAVAIQFVTNRFDKQRTAILEFVRSIDAFHSFVTDDFKDRISKRKRRGKMTPALDDRNSYLVMQAVDKLYHLAAICSRMTEAWNNQLFPTAEMLEHLDRHLGEKDHSMEDEDSRLRNLQNEDRSPSENNDNNEANDEAEIRCTKYDGIDEEQQNIHIGTEIQMFVIPLRDPPFGYPSPSLFHADGEDVRSDKLLDAVRQFEIETKYNLPPEKLPEWLRKKKMWCYVPELNDYLLLAFEKDPEEMSSKLHVLLDEHITNKGRRRRTSKFVDTTVIADANMEYLDFQPMVRDNDESFPEFNITHWIKGRAISVMPRQVSSQATTGNHATHMDVSYCILVTRFEATAKAVVNSWQEKRILLGMQGHKKDLIRKNRERVQQMSLSLGRGRDDKANSMNVQ